MPFLSPTTRLLARYDQSTESLLLGVAANMGELIIFQVVTYDCVLPDFLLPSVS